MNRQLKRIEQTLQRLEKMPSSIGVATVATDVAATAPRPTHSSVSFDLQRSTLPVQDHISSTASDPVQSFMPTMTEPEGTPPAKFQLPNFANQAPGNRGFSRHQNGSNPDIALNLIQEILANIVTDRTELTTIGNQIQLIYREGPIVDGWLECSTQKMENTTQVLRHAAVDDLLDYVAEMAQDPGKSHPEYRLCGIHADGKTWSCPCPPEQIASISLGISRHQKLQPLLLRKTVLEKHLGLVAEEVVKLQSRLQTLAS
jgi:hypothetical protein